MQSFTQKTLFIRIYYSHSIQQVNTCIVYRVKETLELSSKITYNSL